MPDGALQQRAAQQLASDRQLPTSFSRVRMARSRIIYKNESAPAGLVKRSLSDLAVFR
jgi:hypothetical protein